MHRRFVLSKLYFIIFKHHSYFKRFLLITIGHYELKMCGDTVINYTTILMKTKNDR